jgi:hypothetical protein
VAKKIIEGEPAVAKRMGGEKKMSVREIARTMTGHLTPAMVGQWSLGLVVEGNLADDIGSAVEMEGMGFQCLGSCEEHARNPPSPEPRPRCRTVPGVCVHSRRARSHDHYLIQSSDLLKATDHLETTVFGIGTVAEEWSDGEKNT